MKKSLLLGAALMTAAGAMAQIEPGEYYIKNVETGMYLNEGWSWGTHAVVKDYPCAFELSVTDDGYVLKSAYGYIKVDGAKNDETGEEWGEPYMDGDKAKALKIEKAGDAYTISMDNWYFTTLENKEMYLGYIPLYVVNAFAEPKGNNSAWEIISRADMIAALAKASPENPVEASFFLNAGEIQVNANNNISSWTYIKNGKQAEIVIPWPGWYEHNSWNDKSFYAWCVNDGGDGAVAGTDVVYQDVEGMPAGNYKATYRVVNQNNTPLVVKFNESEGKPFEYDKTDLWYASAFESLAQNSETADFSVGEDGKLSIRMEKTINPEEQNRFAFVSFSLYYLGKGSAVENIASDENAPVEYFNLQGIRVANPSDGIYIKRQGKKVSKVVM